MNELSRGPSEQNTHEECVIEEGAIGNGYCYTHQCWHGESEVGKAYRFSPRDSFTQQVTSSFVGVVVGPAERSPYNLPGIWVRVWREVFDDEVTLRLDGPGYAEGWPPVEPATYTPRLPDRYLEQGRLAV